jgi:transcriptional regulator with XRE-family HTH domain
MEAVTMQTELVPKPNPPRLPAAEDSLALRIAYERGRRHWSADELARQMTEAGVPINPSAIWRIENATPRRRITLDEAIGFAKVFGTTLDELVGTHPGDAIDSQIMGQIEKMRLTSGQLRDQRRELVRMIAAAAAATETQDEAALQLVRDLVAEFPWIEEPGAGQ